MNGLNEIVEGWIAFLLACKDLWPAIGIGAAIAWVWSLMRRRLPSVQRWAIKHDKRHYVDIIIVVLTVIFVSGSSYVDLYRINHIEIDLSADAEIKNPYSITGNSLDVQLYIHNNGNRNILLQDIAIYFMEFKDYKFDGSRDYAQQCLSDKTSIAISFLPHSSHPDRIRYNGSIATYYSSAEKIAIGGNNTNFSPFVVNARTSHASTIHIRKHSLDITRANINMSCFVFAFFDANANPHTVVCKGSYGAIIVDDAGDGYLYSGKNAEI